LPRKHNRVDEGCAGLRAILDEVLGPGFETLTAQQVKRFDGFGHKEVASGMLDY